MTAVKGLDSILMSCRPREEQSPTVKQLDFVRNKIGENELDRILMLNLNRGQVTKIIGDWIDAQPKSKPYRQGYTPAYGCDHSWGDGWGGVSGIFDEDCNGMSNYFDREWDEPYYGD